MTAQKTRTASAFLSELLIQPYGLVRRENYETLRNYVIIKPMIVLFKWYDFDVA